VIAGELAQAARKRHIGATQSPETMMMTRRNVGLGVVGAAAAAGLAKVFGGSSEAASNKTATFPVSFSDEEWKRKLTPEQYYVLRQHGTERAGTSPLDHEKRKGTFACAGCDQDLFASDTKFDSGTGWPSFFRPIEGAVGTSEDNTFFMRRTEVHCSRCGGHLGHVFDDGPPPTGLRYCMNGVAMKFRPATAA
jgi:peptide-methionine (R)-S-oxide reductase